MKNRISKRLNRIWKNRQGVTLVELIVTFALISIFAVGTTGLLTNAIRVYHEMKGLNYALQVSDTLMEKISGEIEGAKVSSATWTETEPGHPTVSDPEGTVSIRVSADNIDLYDRTGSHITISTNSSGYLNIHYYEVQGQNQETRYEAVNWTYDKDMYMGFMIKSLAFAREGTGNIIKVTLTLTSDKYGDFTSTRYVECYNFTEEYYNRIS